MARIFGTDGVRGTANADLTCEFTLALGRAAAGVFRGSATSGLKVLIGRDTRVSSGMLESALAAGLCSAGAEVHFAGVIPTPAVAYLVQKYGMYAGAVISASHNPYDQNGIKFFDGNGDKLSDETEDEIQRRLESNAHTEIRGEAIGNIQIRHKCADDYVKRLASACELDFGGMRVAIDCANGAASGIAERLFKYLGAVPCVINSEPNGVNINASCGSTDLKNLAEATVRNRCAVGLAFDGDADRCLAVDELGQTIDGDRILAALAVTLKERGELAENTVTVTSMTNMGFYKAMEKNGITVNTTKVGDRYILEDMRRTGGRLGGEQSGHIIMLKHSTTGDGLLTGAQLVQLLIEKRIAASRLQEIMTRYPQVIINVPVSQAEKAECAEHPEVRQSVAEAEERLGGDGRVVVRPSGTEPLLRVMIEGRDFQTVNTLATKIAETVSRHFKPGN